MSIISNINFKYERHRELLKSFIFMFKVDDFKIKADL